MDGGGIWDGDMGMEGKEGRREAAGEIFEMGVRGGMGYTGLFGERGAAEGKIEAGKRTWGFEKRLEADRGGDIVRKCWQEMKERTLRGRGWSRWEEKRVRFFGDRGMEMDEVEGRREGGGLDFEELIKTDRELDRRERWDKIGESNKWYDWIKGEGMPGYLKKGWGRVNGRGWLNLG